MHGILLTYIDTSYENLLHGIVFKDTCLRYVTLDSFIDLILTAVMHSMYPNVQNDRILICTDHYSC